MRTLVISFLTLLLSTTAFATADGPDYFKLNSSTAVLLQRSPDKRSEVLIQLPPKADALQNLGCQGMPPYAEWEKMSADEKKSSTLHARCKVKYKGYTGWVDQNLLAESDFTPTQTSFDCTQGKSSAEALICQNEELARLDQKLADRYAQAKAKFKATHPSKKDKKYFVAYQRGWIKGRNECWKANEGTLESCIKAAYERRITELETSWDLVPAKEARTYTCANDNHFTFIPFDTSEREGARVAFNDMQDTFIKLNDADANTWEGEFGKKLTFNNGNATLLWDQYEPELKCTLAQSNA